MRFFVSLFVLLLAANATKAQSFQDFYNGLPELTTPYNFNNDQHTSYATQSLPANLQNQHDDYSSFSAVGRIDLETDYFYILIKRTSPEDGTDVYILFSIDENESIKSSLVVGVENAEGKGTDFKIESDKTLRVAYYGDEIITIMDYTYADGLLSSNPVTQTVDPEQIANL